MASSQAVFLKCGEQPRAFPFGNLVNTVTSTTTNQASLPVYKEAIYSSFQLIVAGTGAVTATATIQASNDDNTGRGFVLGGTNAPGTQVTTTSGTTGMTSPGQQFNQSIVGATVVCPGVPAGTTVASVTNAGTLVLSTNATVTSANAQAVFYANNWLATVLGTITLTGTTNVTDGFTTQAAWRYVRANVTNVTGTGATATVLMGV